MFKKLKVTYLLFFLIPTVLSASVSITGVSYNEAESQLIFKFDTQVQYDNVILSRISIKTDAGDVNLSDGSEILSTSNTDSLVISLLYSDAGVTSIAQKDALEKATKRDQMAVLVGENTFLDLNDEGNGEITQNDNLLLNYIARSDELILQDVTYDAGINELELTFNRNVQVDLNYVRYQFIDINGVLLSVTGNEILTSANDAVIKIKIGKADQKAIESSDLSAATASAAKAFRDEKYNPSDAASVSLNVIADPAPLEIVAAEYNAGDNTVLIDFNEAILNPSLSANFFPSGITISDGGLHEDIVLVVPLFVPEDEGDPAKWIGVKTENANTRLAVIVPVIIQETIETVMNTSNLRISVAGFTVYDDLENGNEAASAVTVNYIVDDKPFFIDPANTVYDAGINKLSLVFNERIDIQNEVDYLGISLVDPADTTKKFVFESVDEEDLVINSTRKKVDIDLTGEQEAILESYSALQLLLEPFSVFSKDKNPNGNVGVTMADNVIINVAADETPPVAESVQYNAKDGLLILKFDDAVSRTSFVPTGVTFAGIPLDNAGEVTDIVNSKYLTYKVSDPTKSALNQISDAIKVAPKFSLNEGVVKNLAGSDNMPIIDGEDGEEYLVGYGRSFWTRGKEKFPPQNPDKIVFASIRKIGAYSEIYVEDEEWNISVTHADVDSLYNAFEVKLSNAVLDETYSTGGIYHMLTMLFGEPTDIDQNGKVSILLYDVRDDYFIADDDAAGRNDTNRKIYNPGYIEKGDQLSVAENPKSNEADVLYIDTNPQIIIPLAVVDEDDPRFPTGINALADVFHRIIANNETPLEKQWLVEGLSSLSQFLATSEWSAFMEDAVLKNTASNNLTFFAVEFVTRDNQMNAFLFNLYMYERFGLDYITELAGYTRKTGISRIDWILTSSLDPGVTIDDVFRDYAIACLFDKVEYDPGDPTTVTDHQYGFINVDVARPGIIGLGPLQFFKQNTGSVKASTSWSYSFLQVAGFDVTGENKFNTGIANDGAIMINGDDEATIEIVGVTQDRNQLESVVTDFHLVSAALDENNQGQLPFQISAGDSTITFREDYKTMILVVLNTGNQNVQIAFTNDVSQPEFARLSVVKNALIDRFLDIYLSSNEALYSDITEGPSINLLLANKDTIELVVEKMFESSGPALNTYLYHAGFDVSTPGTFEIIAAAKDLSGNQIVVDKGSVSVAKYAGSGQATLTMQDNLVMQFDEKSLSSGSYIYVVRLPERNVVDNPDENSITDVYSIMTSSKINGQFTVSIPYQESRLTSSENDIGLYRLDTESQAWLPVAGQIDKQNNRVVAELNSEGYYQLRKGVSGLETLPETFTLFQNYPNPFNPNTTIRFSTPEQSHVRVTVFNLLGQKIRTLVDEEYLPGYHTVVWNGTDDRNQPVASGIFFYSFKAGNTMQIKKMVLLK